jgi:sugar fermentation stimulation protein A
VGLSVCGKVRILKGKFLKRINRFVCEVECGSEVLRAHLNNTGKLLDLLVESRVVLLTPINGEKLKFRIVGTETESEYFTLIDTGLQERAFLEAQRMGLIPFLDGFKLLKRNPKVEGEVIDFLFWKEGREIFVELKSAVYYFPEDKKGGRWKISQSWEVGLFLSSGTLWRKNSNPLTMIKKSPKF